MPTAPAAPVTRPTAPGAAAAEPVGLVDVLARMPEVWRRLLRLHVPDALGRCRGCTSGGTGLPAGRWPCVLHGLAELAGARRETGAPDGAHDGPEVPAPRRPSGPRTAGPTPAGAGRR
jgi:hypothetical protein